MKNIKKEIEKIKFDKNTYKYIKNNPYLTIDRKQLYKSNILTISLRNNSLIFLFLFLKFSILVLLNDIYRIFQKVKLIEIPFRIFYFTSSMVHFILFDFAFFFIYFIMIIVSKILKLIYDKCILKLQAASNKSLKTAFQDTKAVYKLGNKNAKLSSDNTVYKTLTLLGINLMVKLVGSVVLYLVNGVWRSAIEAIDVLKAITNLDKKQIASKLITGAFLAKVHLKNKELNRLNPKHKKIIKENKSLENTNFIKVNKELTKTKVASKKINKDIIKKNIPEEKIISEINTIEKKLNKNVLNENLEKEIDKQFINKTFIRVI